MNFIINENVLVYLIIGIAFLVFAIFVFAIIILVNTVNKNDSIINLISEIRNMRISILKDLHDNYEKVIDSGYENNTKMLSTLQNSLDKINTSNENKLNELREMNDKKLNSIEHNINEKLDKSLNERLDSSFRSIGEQLQNLQNTNGKLLNMSETISDLHKSLSSVKERGIFGEKQLENILENLMTKNMYEVQYKVKQDSNRIVDFAIKIPDKNDNGFVYLPIDSKFPNDRYMEIVRASKLFDEAKLNTAIKNLKDAILFQAKSIFEKYVEPPETTEFAVMFLPTEGLYAECLRIDDLANDCQTKHHVLLAGPTTITAIINSFSVGFKFLQINKNSKEIAKILQAIKTQYSKFGDEIEKTRKSIENAAESTEQLAKRNKSITNKLKDFSELGIDESNGILEIEKNNFLQ